MGAEGVVGVEGSVPGGVPATGEAPGVDPVEPKFVGESGVGAVAFVKGATFCELPIAVGQGKVLAASPPIELGPSCRDHGD